jgi:hypothetical protein
MVLREAESWARFVKLRRVPAAIGYMPNGWLSPHWDRVVRRIAGTALGTISQRGVSSF